ncbi:hypothetical protein [Kribbella lupini]|uniref:Uncharacterized protein n=1 Tax=Kribbella lupini TaxID=291602 RepID=A0ABN2CIB7_9ACTN
MPARFTIRPSDDNSGTFGVWDGAVNGWRAHDLATKVDAQRVVTELDIQFNAYGPRPADDFWPVTPARPVQRAEWQPGELDAWIRDDDGQILGRFRAPDGSLAWIPSGDLRPLTDG